jgi:predicted TPR repeat methyltransferase
MMTNEPRTDYGVGKSNDRGCWRRRPRRRRTTTGWTIMKILVTIFVFGLAWCSKNVVVTVTAFSRATPSSSGSGDEQEQQQQHRELIEDAIQKCRAKISESDTTKYSSMYPKTRIRLAILLESTNNNNSNVYDEEIEFLYETAATNETLQTSEKINSWTNAAKFSNTTTAKRERLLRALTVTTPIDYNDDDDDDNSGNIISIAYAHAFEEYIQLVLQECTFSVENPHLFDLLDEGLDLCDQVERLCPKEPVVDEFRGVLLRKKYKNSITSSPSSSFSSSSTLTSTSTSMMILNAEGDTTMGDIQQLQDTRTAPTQQLQQQVYETYAMAARKSYESVILAIYGDRIETSSSSYGSLPSVSTINLSILSPTTTTEMLCSRLLRHIILAAAAAREARMISEEDEHIKFGQEIMIKMKQHIIKDINIQLDFWNAVGITYKSRGEEKIAKMMFRKSLEINPNDGHANAQLASLGDKVAASSTSFSSEYVSGLFDGYSDRFEKELVEVLDYRGHIIVADATRRHTPSSVLSQSNQSSIVVVDLGVGTGLLGSLFREMYPSNTNNMILWGVDISNRMVQQSQNRMLDNGDFVYDTVMEMDVNMFLQNLDSSYVHVVGASDVFIYVGDLKKLFIECHRVLSVDGLLVFTVEFPSSEDVAAKGQIKKNGVGLLKSGRFGHSRHYIQGLAKDHNYDLLEWREEVLRKQGSDSVHGAVVVLKKKVA